MITEKDIILCGHGSGTPRTIRMDTYLSERYSKIVKKNGKKWRKGVVAAVRPKKMTDELRKAYVAKYRTILGRNKYSQVKRKFCYVKYSDGCYYSDCSSSQNLTYKEIGMDISSLNTEETYQSSKFEKLPVKIKDGHIINPEILKIGDQLLFAGADDSRELNIGHTEGIYAIYADSTESTAIEDFQRWMNEYYLMEVILSTGAKLQTDGEYGRKTRAAAVGIFKYMLNKYYDAKLTVVNPHFYDSTKAAAEKATLAESKKHGTFAAILQGLLAAQGCYKDAITATVTPETLSGLKQFKKSKNMKEDTKLTGDVWQLLFAEVK